MTDDGRYLSRRERRAQEEREATSVPADTDALAMGPISESIPTHAPDGRMLTRRERRRLERSRQPMETWTAEEEMIATGQIPAMTPERIAEQEKLARERAAAAQEEAEAVSAEIEGIAERPEVEQSAPHAVSEQQWDTSSAISAPSAPSASAPAPTYNIADALAPAEESAPEFEQTTEPATEQTTEQPTEQTSAWAPVAAPDQAQQEDQRPPERASFIAAVAADSVSPEQPDSPPETVSPEQPLASEQPAPPHSFEPARSFEPAQQFEPAQPLVSPADETPHESAPSVSTPVVPAPAPVAIPGMPPGMSPEMFAELFPPGSLQRRMMEDQAASEAAEKAQVEDPAAEIRRLTQEAVAGIDAASVRAIASAAPRDNATPIEDAAPTESATPPIEPIPDAAFNAAPVDEQPAPWGSPAPGSESAPEYYDQPPAPESAPPADVPHSGPPTFSIPMYGDQAEAPDQQAAAPEPAAEQPPLEQTPFDAILGDHPGTAALDQVSSASAEFGSPNFGDVGAGPATQSEPAMPEPHGFVAAPEQATPWGAHPLSQVDREAPELPEMPPAQGVPHPDLSGIGFRGAAADRSNIPPVEPVPTGQIEVPPRERPELDSADMPRHFKWAHLAVFGAVALLLGVVVWHVI